ncbi:MAG: hemolysin family protein [Acidimicrobiales bacterium]
MDLARDLPLLLVLAALVGFAIVLAAAEASLLRVSRVQVEVRADAGSRRARRLAGLLGDLTRVLNSVLLAVLLVQIGAATVTGILTSRWFDTIGVTIGSFVLTLILFVYAEAIPKTYAVRHPLTVALSLGRLVHAITVVLWPVVTALVWFADLQAPGRDATSSGLDDAELLRLAEESEAAGIIEASDRRLMEAGFRLGDMRVDEIMVPRTDVVAVAHDTGVSEALDRAITSGHRRLPVHDGGLDGIIGVVRLRELARVSRLTQTTTLTELMRPVLTVPESKRVIHLLREMQQHRLHLAVVIDEYGGTAGIVTIEDVVEDVLGPVADEDASGETLIAPLGEGQWRIAGSCPVDALEHALGVDLPAGDWHTAAGLVIGMSGRILGKGEDLVVGDVRFIVTEATQTRIERLELRA